MTTVTGPPAPIACNSPLEPTSLLPALATTAPPLVLPLVDRYADYVTHREKVNADYTDDQLDLIFSYLERPTAGPQPMR